jgi:hypothetical protein
MTTSTARRFGWMELFAWHRVRRRASP